MDIKAIFGSVYFRIFISITLIIVLLMTQDIEAIKEAISLFNVVYILAALCLLMTGTLISGFRWQNILKTSDVNVPVWILFSLYLKGYFYNNFLPTQFGGDVYKAIALGNKIQDQSLSLFSVFMDRFAGLLVLLTLGLFGVSSMFGYKYLLGATVLFIIGLLLYFPVLNIFAKKVKFFAKFKDASELLVRDKKRGTIILLLSLCIQLLSYGFTYVLFLGFGVSLSLQQVFGFFPVFGLATLIPSFNGLGSQELVFSTLLSGISAIAVGVSIMSHIVRLIMSLIGGLFILFNIGGKTIDVGDKKNG